MRGPLLSLPFLVLAGLCQVAAVPADSLLRNGSFVEANRDGDWPNGWGSFAPGSGKTWEKEEGIRFLRILPSRDGDMQSVYQAVKLEAGRGYPDGKSALASACRPPGLLAAKGGAQLKFRSGGWRRVRGTRSAIGSVL